MWHTSGWLSRNDHVNVYSPLDCAICKYLFRAKVTVVVQFHKTCPISTVRFRPQLKHVGLIVMDSGDTKFKFREKYMYVHYVDSVTVMERTNLM